MSTSELQTTRTGTDVGAEPDRDTRPSGAAALARLVRSELRLVLLRRRNVAMLAVLACGPLLIGIAVRVAGQSSGGPAFLGQITENGLFLVFTSLTVALPLFLPLTIAVVSGESVAGEASTGTLRNLLVVPVGRTRLLVVKLVSVLVFGLVATLVVWASAVVVGLALFPRGDMLLLSGTSVGLAEGFWRALLVALYVAAMLAGLGAIGVFVSTLTEVPMGAMAATAVLTILTQIVGTVPQVRVVWPYLFTNPWFAYGDLLRTPVAGHAMLVGLLTQALYVAVFGSLAWARLSSKDVSS
ncbi:MAG TPA: ABC transporter permease subunit [Actinomycetales bacterium]|nr:ABC transporter permease subunit [Actinomycetales bacterium]